MGCYHGLLQDIFQRSLPCPISRREFPPVRPISLFENGGNLMEYKDEMESKNSGLHAKKKDGKYIFSVPHSEEKSVLLFHF